MTHAYKRTSDLHDVEMCQAICDFYLRECDDTQTSAFPTSEAFAANIRARERRSSALRTMQRALRRDQERHDAQRGASAKRSRHACTLTSAYGRISCLHRDMLISNYEQLKRVQSMIETHRHATAADKRVQWRH